MPCLGQFKLTPLSQSYSNSQKKQVLTLPFWDDFSASQNQPDTTMWLFGNTVYVNATIAHNPPTYKAATFDGINGNGRAYDISGLFRGKTDSLVSQPINMTTAERATTFMSFYWQAKGNGEAPDENDSLRLQIKSNETTNPWKTIWSQTGEVETFDFQQVMIKIDEPIFFHDSVQLKFEAFGSLNGQFDSWNIDYIYLNDGRNLTDLNYFDRALSGSPSALFGLYTQIPFAHLLDNDTVRFASQSVLASNLSGSDFPLVYRHILSNETQQIEYTNELLSNSLIGGVENYFLLDTIFSPAISLHKSNFENELDSQIVASTFIFFTEDEESENDTSPGIDLEINDTIKVDYLLHDQYAYDDGTAEFAAGINLRTGQLAVRFAPLTTDTLTHLRIHFPDITPDTNGNPIDLIVWGDNLENERIRQPYTIAKSVGLNAFSEIKLDNSIIVSDTFYIGYQQFTDNFVSIGFDRNNPNAAGAIFTNTTGEWQQNERLKGALMIRPVFKRDTSVILSQKKWSAFENIKVYPNPATSHITIEGEYDKIEIFNLSGQLKYQSSNNGVHQLTGLNKGLFLMKIFFRDQFIVRKLILE